MSRFPRFVVETVGGSRCGYHVPEPTRLGKMSKPLRPSRHRFLKARYRNMGDFSCLEHATEPSPPRSADGSSAADTPTSGFPTAVGLWKAPLDCSLYQRAEGALTTARPPLSLTSLHWCFLHLWEFFSSCPVSPSVNGLLYQPVLSHTPPS